VRAGRLATEPPRPLWFRRRPPRGPVNATEPRLALSRGRTWAAGLGTPALVLMAAFFIYPFGVIVFHAFTEWDGIAPSQWVGLQNLTDLIHDPVMGTALKNNALFALFVPVQVAASLIIAVLVYQRTPGWRVFRAVFFLPAVMSPIVIGLMWTAIFDLHGPLNEILDSIGLSGVSRDWLGDPSTSIPAIMVVVLWATFGFNMMIYLAGLSAMSPTLIDAARVDGAGWWGTLWYVIVPSLRRVTELVFVLNLITAFAYMLPFIFVMTGGGPGYKTYVTEYLIYDEGFNFGHLGYASAISLALFAIVSVLMFAYIRLLRRTEA
jgi:multiple sugar transport system permease protein